MARPFKSPTESLREPGPEDTWVVQQANTRESWRHGPENSIGRSRALTPSEDSEEKTLLRFLADECARSIVEYVAIDRRAAIAEMFWARQAGEGRADHLKDSYSKPLRMQF